MSASAISDPATARLFTGLDIPLDVTERLSALVEGLRPAAALRWSPIGNLHITTKFIGNWPVDRLAEMQTALEVATRNSGAFDLEIRGLGWFPNPHQPHTFWVGVDGGTALPALHQTVDAATAALGVPKETKAYSPHLTLARVPRGEAKADLAPLRRAVAALESVEFGAFRADHLYLYRSTPTAAGSVYVKLANFPL